MKKYTYCVFRRTLRPVPPLWVHINHPGLFLARDSIYAIARYMLSPVHPSVCLSVTRVDQSTTAEVWIVQLSPQSSPIPLSRNSDGFLPRGASNKGGVGKQTIFCFCASISRKRYY